MVMGSLRQETDLAVIGAGPGGYVAALRAADLGIETMLIEERGRPGGVCLIEGCIPSKALIRAVEVADIAARAEAMGVKFGPPTFDLDRLRAWKGEVVEALVKGTEGLLARRGVEVVKGRARFEGPRSLALEDGAVAGVDFRRAIVATGSVVAPFAPARELPVWTSTEALDVPEIPERLLVVGGGYIGLELGQLYHGLGSQVTVVEFFPRLLAGADPDLVDIMLRRCKECFAGLLVESKVVGLEKTAAGLAARVEHQGETRTLEADRVLIAVGRNPNTEGLGLEKAGVRLDAHGRIQVGPDGRTSAERIYAIGDATPGPMLAHKASREAKVVAEVLAGLPSAFDNRAIPAVVYTDPEIAWTGLTEREAAEQGRKVRVGKFPLSALGRTRTLGRTDGAVKILCDPDSQLVLGVGMVGPHVSELVAEGTLAIEMGATLEDLMATIHPHPTISEAIMEAAEVAAGHPIHINPPRKKRE